MPMFKVKDTITVERIWRIMASSEQDAINQVQNGDAIPESEEQIDNTPYEAEEYDVER